VTVTGTIEDYTGRGLILKTGRGTGSVRYAPEEVLDVRTRYEPQHEAARKLFAEGKVAEAELAFKAALDEEDRTWVRREILASQVKCALWAGDSVQAARRFLPLVDSDPDTLYYGLIPLVWDDAPPATASAAEARRWLQGTSAAARLIGASWLYHGVDRKVAQQALQTLATDPQPSIQRLAQMQLWRARLDARDLTLPEIRRWAVLTDELRVDLRAGPLFLIGRAYEQQHDDLNAAAAWLWLPFEYAEHRQLAAEAQLRAATALFRAGDSPAARQQARELLLRFADTPAAARIPALQQRWNESERRAATPSAP
jgi:hypothetical protein